MVVFAQPVHLTKKHVLPVYWAMGFMDLTATVRIIQLDVILCFEAWFEIQHLTNMVFLFVIYIVNEI